MYYFQRYLEAVPLRCELINRFFDSINTTTAAEEQLFEDVLEIMKVYIDEHPSDCYERKMIQQIGVSYTIR